MTLAEFADRYRVKVRKDSCGDEVIPGRLVKGVGPDRVENHHHVYRSDRWFFAYLNFPSRGRWNGARRRLEAAGAKIMYDWEFEGILEFDPENKDLVKKVLRETGVRIRRQLDEVQRQSLRERLARRSA